MFNLVLRVVAGSNSRPMIRKVAKGDADLTGMLAAGYAIEVKDEDGEINTRSTFRDRQYCSFCKLLLFRISSS